VIKVLLPVFFLVNKDFQSSFHVIDLKLDIEPSLTPQRPAAARCAALRGLRLLQHGARWSVVMNIYAQSGLTVGK